MVAASMKLSTRKAYFQLAIDLHHFELDLVKAFESQDTSPIYGVDFDIKDLRSQLQAIYGVRPQFKCSTPHNSVIKVQRFSYFQRAHWR